MKRSVFVIFLLLILITAGMVSFPLFSSAEAQQEQEEDLYEMPASRTIRIDEKTVERGITVSAGSGEIVIGIPPKALSSAMTVGMEFAPLDAGHLPKGWAPTSHGWQMSLSLDKGIEILKPITMIVRVPEKDFVYQIARWDESRERWNLLPTTNRWKQQEVRVMINRVGTYALLADTAHHLWGRATWYPDRLSKDTRFAAASNEYPLRAKLKVTNAQTDEFVIVTVQSVGPFVNGRIIDLTKTAFSKIGYPRKQGVLTVVVEPIDKK